MALGAVRFRCPVPLRHPWSGGGVPGRGGQWPAAGMADRPTPAAGGHVPRERGARPAAPGGAAGTLQ